MDDDDAVLSPEEELQKLRILLEELKATIRAGYFLCLYLQWKEII